MPKVTTLEYDASRLYREDEHVYIVDGRFSTYLPDGIFRIPFGRVAVPPTREQPELEIAVYTDIFRLNYYQQGPR